MTQSYLKEQTVYLCLCACRARHHLHIVFATSPVGSAFRTRCRQYPSLVNCMTIDWYSTWPSEALLGVGIRILEGLSLVPGPAAAANGAPASGSQNGTQIVSAASANGASGGVLQGSAAPGPAGAAAANAAESIVVRVARMCVEIHKGVEAEAERLHQQQQRR
jgi:hypothetical protein